MGRTRTATRTDAMAHPAAVRRSAERSRFMAANRRADKRGKSRTDKSGVRRMVQRAQMETGWGGGGLGSEWMLSESADTESLSRCLRPAVAASLLAGIRW